MSEAQYLIIKRGLYYRPNSGGYTGLKDEAGRYSLYDAEDISHPNGEYGPRDGMSYMHENDAPDYAPQCCIEVKCGHMMQRIAEMQERDRQWQAEAKSLMEKGIETAFRVKSLKEQLQGEILLCNRMAAFISGDLNGAEWNTPNAHALLVDHKARRHKFKAAH